MIVGVTDQEYEALTDRLEEQLIQAKHAYHEAEKAVRNANEHLNTAKQDVAVIDSFFTSLYRIETEEEFQNLVSRVG